MSALGPTLSIWVQGVNEFQQLGLINQATMCAIGVDVPFVAFSKNKTEREERLFRSFLILFLAFGLAPIHSTALARHCQHSIFKVFKRPRQTRFIPTQLQKIVGYPNLSSEYCPRIAPFETTCQ
jgi:hypothetical protein